MEDTLLMEHKASIAKVRKLRWRIVALLFFATTINYIDRNVLSFVMLDDGFKASMLGLESGTILTSKHNSDLKS